MVELPEDVVAPERRQVAADARLVAHRDRDPHGLVLKELGDVEEHPGRVDRDDRFTRHPDVAERLGMERVADHYIAVDGEGQGEPDRRYLERERQGVDVREEVGVQPAVPRPLLLVFFGIVQVLHE